jgi:hypothetical protein
VDSLIWVKLGIITKLETKALVRIDAWELVLHSFTQAKASKVLRYSKALTCSDFDGDLIAFGSGDIPKELVVNLISVFLVRKLGEVVEITTRHLYQLVHWGCIYRLGCRAYT